MKKILFFVLAALTFAACEQALVEEQSAICPDVPETITVGFEGDDTRIQLNDAQKTVWTSGDLVSVFYLSDANQQWQYTGETGARTAKLTRVNAGNATTTTTGVVVVYPYNENYYLNTRTLNVKATLPATQTYLEDSYGLDGNILISQSEYNNISLKNVCGWLKLQLTGEGEKVRSITLRGNNGEQVAGELYINSADATATLASDMGDVTEDEGENVAGGAGGNLVFEDTVLKEVTLNCVDGVTLGAEATAFYIALPPQTFTKGITVEITATNGLVMTKSTDNEVVIERNHIQPMTTFDYNGILKPANNEIWYTNGSTTEPTAPYAPSAFGDATIQSNTYNAEKECWVIKFDKDLTTIGEGAFDSCDSLTSVTIPDSVTTIGEGAFWRCTSLTSVTIPDSVTTIGEGAFENCDSLTSVTIPDSVTTIGDYTFCYCTSLTSVTIPDSVTTIGAGAFCGCEGLKEFKGKFAADNGRCLIMDNTIIAYANESGTTYTIPDSVTTIGGAAFGYCESLASVTIPDSVTTIGIYAFFACTSLTSVTIGDSVTTIGFAAFSDCDSLTSVTIPDSVTTIGDEAFAYCNSLASVTIGDSVTTIGGGAFCYCTSLTSVTIPNSVTTIGYGAFYNCDSLTSVTIPDSVTTIGEWAFAGCDSLTSVTIPDSVTTIGNYAFRDCSSLTSVTIPDSVTTIGDEAFSGCSSLTSVTIPDSVTTIGRSAFYDCRRLTSVTIPDSVTTIGEGAFYKCSSLTSVTIGDSVTTIGNYAFCYCSSLTSVTIGDSVTTIGDYAFYDCDSLTSVTIPDSVTTIGEQAFCGCTSLTSVTIPDSVTTIGYGAFAYCYSLKTVYCKPTTPPTGGDYMFYNNASDRKLYVPASDDDSIINAYKEASGWSEYKDDIFEEGPANNEIWYTNGSTTEPTAPYKPTAFGGATIQSNTYDAEKECWVITFDKDITEIGDDAFYGYQTDCNKLTSVTIPNSVTTIGSSAFAYCTSLTSVTIPDSVTTIGECAFAGCKSLKEFKGKFAADGGRCLIKDNAIIAYAEASGTTYTIPDSVTTIGSAAFSWCDSLTSVTIPDSVTTIRESAFYNCISLTSVTIPDSVTTIGDWAFSWCDSLKTVYCKPTTPPAGGDGMFDCNAAGRRIFVPASDDDSIINAYKTAYGWKSYSSSICEDESL